MADAATLAWYAAHAAERAARCEAADTADLHARLRPAGPAGGRALDAGCGSGRDVAFLRTQGREALGVDASPEMVAEARRLHPGCADHLQVDTLPALASLGEARFACVSCTAVLMHLPPAEIAPALRRLRALVADGGTLLVSIPAGPPAATDDLRDTDGRCFTPILPEDVRGRVERLGLPCAAEQAWGQTGGPRQAWRVLEFRAPRPG